MSTLNITLSDDDVEKLAVRVAEKLAEEIARERADENELIDEVTLARELKVARETLQAWRHRKRGPAFQKFGRSVRYQRAEVERWKREGKL